MLARGDSSFGLKVPRPAAVSGTTEAVGSNLTRLDFLDGLDMVVHGQAGDLARFTAITRAINRVGTMVDGGSQAKGAVSALKFEGKCKGT